MKGKDKCKILKEIRQKIADENDIEFITQECTHKGDCKGTCPKCESELRYLEKELEKRNQFGKKVVITSLCTSMIVGMVGCGNNGDKGDNILVDNTMGIVGPGSNREYTYDIKTTEATTTEFQPYIEGIEDLTVSVGTDINRIIRLLGCNEIKSSGRVSCDYSFINPDIPDTYPVYWTSDDGASLITYVTVTDVEQENITKETTQGE